MHSYRRETAQQCGLVMAQNEKLELGDNIYRHYRSIFKHCDVIVGKAIEFSEKKRKIRAITPFKVIQGNRFRCWAHWKALSRFPISVK